MYVAIVSSDKQRARQLGDDILDACLKNGCYSTFLDYAAGEGFLSELREREFGTVVIAVNSENEWRIAEAVAASQPQAKLILLGSDEAAVKGYTLNAAFCLPSKPKEEELKQIVQIIFPIGKDEVL